MEDALHILRAWCLEEPCQKKLLEENMQILSK